MMLQYISWQLILTFLCSLQAAEPQEPILEEIYIKIGDLNRTKNLSEFFDHIAYIPLDPSVLIDQIIDLEISEDRIIVLERTFGGDRNLYIYDRQGKLLHKLTGNIKGTGSFAGAYDFLIDHEREVIQILDVRRRKIIDFSMDGQLLQETATVDEIAFHFFIKHPSSKQYIFHSGNEVTHNDRYNIFYVSEDLENKKSRSQYIPSHILNLGFMYSPFVRSNERDSYYKEWYNDTIFYVGETALIPKYHLKFANEEWLTEEERKNISQDNIEYIVNEIDRNPYVISEVRNFIDRKNHLLLTFNYNKKRYWCTYNKQTKQAEFFLPGENDLDAGINPMIWSFNTQESIVFNVNAGYLLEYYRELYNSKTPEELAKLMTTNFKHFAALIDQIKDSSNPVLMITDFKEDF